MNADLVSQVGFPAWSDLCLVWESGFSCNAASWYLDLGRCQ
jgi:hypothetical protein